MTNRHPELKLIAPSASPEQAAAVVAALERFMRATAPAPAQASSADPEPWQRAAILEGVERAAQGELRDPWVES
jgi:predicted transcriptional regulator